LTYDTVHGASLLRDLLIAPFGMVESSEQNAGTLGLHLWCFVGTHQLAQRLFFFGC
jgi:hypothetical protein